jgi:hypothetical protein
MTAKGNSLERFKLNFEYQEDRYGKQTWHVCKAWWQKAVDWARRK